MKRKKHSGKRLTAMFVSCALCLACTACQAEDSASSAQPVVIGAGLRAYLTLPEMVEGFSIMAYGKIMEKGDVGLPDPELDPATNSRLYGKPVTFQVIDAIKGCEDGETITYWELGGEAPDGNLYVHPELCTGEVGGLFLLILNGPDYYYIPSASTPLPANEDGTLSLPDGFLDLGDGTEAFSTDESITMEAYIELLQEQVLELTPEDAPSDVLAEAEESG